MSTVLKSIAALASGREKARPIVRVGVTDRAATLSDLKATTRQYQVSGVTGYVPRMLNPYDLGIETAVVDRYFATHLAYRPIHKFAVALSTLRWSVETRDARGKWSATNDHPLVSFMLSPNGKPGRGKFPALISRAVIDAHLCGNGVQWKKEGSGSRHPGAPYKPLVGLRRVIPRLRNVETVQGKDDEYLYTLYDGSIEPFRTLRLTTSQIVHFQFPNPLDETWGVSPLVAASDQFDLSELALAWNKNAFNTRGGSGGVYSVKHELTEPEYKTLMRRLEEMDRKGYGTRLITNDATYQDFTKSAVEMDYNAGSKSVRDDILSDLDMPPVVAGYFDNATLANAKESRRIFWEDSAIPLATWLIGNPLNDSLVPHFGDPEKLRLIPDPSSVPALRDALESRAKTFFTFRNCAVPYEECVAVMGLPFSGEQEDPPARSASNVALDAEAQGETDPRSDGPLDDDTPGPRQRSGS